jgi:hypothetical protein
MSERSLELRETVVLVDSQAGRPSRHDDPMTPTTPMSPRGEISAKERKRQQNRVAQRTYRRNGSICQLQE